MPIIKSAKKRVRVAKKATVRNVKTKRGLKAAIKAFHSALTSKKGADKALSKAQSNLDKASKKNIMHKNKVARKQRQLAKAAKAASVKPVAKKKAATKKTAVKKTTAKKSPAKKTAAKKSTKKSTKK